MRMVFSTIAVSPVWALENGDLISMECIGSFISGRIKKIPKSKTDLSESDLSYFKSQGVTVPDWPQTIGGPSNRCLLGDFYSPGVHYKHIFVDVNKNVAVFLKKAEDHA